MELVSDGLSLKVKAAEKSGNDAAFRRSSNNSDCDDERAVNLSRGPTVLRVQCDVRLAVKPTRSVLRRERESTRTSGRVDLDVLSPTQVIRAEESSGEWVKVADEGVSEL